MRPSIDEYFLEIAEVVATRSTCARRSVGAVAVDADNHIVSTGYNGTPKGAKHCIDEACDGALFSTTTNLNKCESIHAEQNLIAHCKVPKKIHTVYLTVSPCVSCMKLIAATGCKRIVAKKVYDQSSIDFFRDTIKGTVIIAFDPYSDDMPF